MNLVMFDCAYCGLFVYVVINPNVFYCAYCGKLANECGNVLMS